MISYPKNRNILPRWRINPYDNRLRHASWMWLQHLDVKLIQFFNPLNRSTAELLSRNAHAREFDVNFNIEEPSLEICSKFLYIGKISRYSILSSLQLCLQLCIQQLADQKHYSYSHTISSHLQQGTFTFLRIHVTLLDLIPYPKLN